MSEDKVSRRKVVKDGAAVAAGIAISLGASEVLGAVKTQPACKHKKPCEKKIRSRNENMEYRRFGKTNLMVSCISLGGHWKQIPYEPGTEDFKKNRHDVISACIDHGINLVDACTSREAVAYGEALKKRKEKMYFCYSWYEHEMRFEPWQSVAKLTQSLEEGLRVSQRDSVDVWRITCHEWPAGKHTPEHEEITIKALENAKKAGKARFVGISSHDRMWLQKMIETYPQLDMILTPYHADTKRKKDNSLFDAIKKRNVGLLGIKPFSSGSVFKSRGKIIPATKKADDEIARLTLRRVLENEALTASIPGLISIDQVKNAAQAVLERRKFNPAESAKFQQIVNDMWARLPEDYQWLKQWEWV